MVGFRKKSTTVQFSYVQNVYPKRYARYAFTKTGLNIAPAEVQCKCVSFIGIIFRRGGERLYPHSW